MNSCPRDSISCGHKILKMREMKTVGTGIEK